MREQDKKRAIKKIRRYVFAYIREFFGHKFYVNKRQYNRTTKHKNQELN
jgi:hypothetical protein